MTAYNVTKNGGCSDESDGDFGSCTNLAAFDPCTKENFYGYTTGTPCIFMKLRKDYDWLPQFYNLSHLPKHLPVELKEHIEEMSEEDKNSTVKQAKLSRKLLISFPCIAATNLD